MITHLHVWFSLDRNRHPGLVNRFLLASPVFTIMPLSLNNVFREPRFLLVTAWEGIALFARSPRRTQRFCENVALANTLLWQDVLGRPHTRSGQHSELGHSPASARHQVRACRWVTDSAANRFPSALSKASTPELSNLATVSLYGATLHRAFSHRTYVHRAKARCSRDIGRLSNQP